jgi:hypothetical protein
VLGARLGQSEEDIAAIAPSVAAGVTLRLTLRIATSLAWHCSKLETVAVGGLTIAAIRF